MSYYNIHFGKMRQTYTIPKSKFEKGMVLKISYKSKETGILKDYIAIVLNPRYKKYTHLLSLENISYEQINDFANMVGLKPIVTMKNISKFNISKLIMNTSSYRFYNKEVKYFLDHYNVSAYRTFLQTGFINNMVVDYEFNNEIMKKYGF